MQIKIIVINRSKAMAVRTLHMLLCINQTAMVSNLSVEYHFINDDPESIKNIIQKYLKSTVRLLFIDYGAATTPSATGVLLSDFPDGGSVMVAPVVKHNIDWDTFKTKVNTKSTEPVHQLGLNFDTVLDKKIGDGMWTVKETLPSIWSMDMKPVFKKIKGEKGLGTKIPLLKKDFFQILKDKKVKILAYTKAETVTQFQHECISNILNAAGITVNPNESQGTSV